MSHKKKMSIRDKMMSTMMNVKLDKLPHDEGFEKFLSLLGFEYEDVKELTFNELAFKITDSICQNK